MPRHRHTRARSASVPGGPHADFSEVRRVPVARSRRVRLSEARRARAPLWSCGGRALSLAGARAVARSLRSFAPDDLESFMAGRGVRCLGSSV